ncbi:hypothetical protein HHX48_05110 [Salinimonas sp. HHU 13199]|uniref:SMODS and SLOG-associating 2TM effector domain-containing protein n=1 Tax=Salinimonas profundi TaxID=2729140 RepID=A0ABR8LHA8_9ALTE|nr:hypothetical protein [Salinimonas profundi]MBD3585112.1 hypothetical protein [Salinimonas profundi]
MSDRAVTSVYQQFVDSPLVPMTLRVGVAGHREHASISQDNDILIRQITTLYSLINTQLKRCHTHAHAQTLYAKAEPVLRLISSMADGADRLLLEPSLVKEDYELACVLPFDAREYAKDFDADSQRIYFELLQKAHYGTPESKVLELDGRREEADIAYRDCAEVLVKNCDVLIALYDGKDKAGYGTAWTTTLALSEKIPVIWIDTEYACQLYFMHRENGKTITEPFTETALHKWLGHILLFDTLLCAPDDVRKNDLTWRILQRFNVFASEPGLSLRPEIVPDFNDRGPVTMTRGRKSLLHNGFACLRRMLISSDSIKQEVRRHEAQLPQSAKLADDGDSPQAENFHTPASHAYFAAYLRADRLASFYASMHRSTFLYIYLFGAAALMVAALAIAFSDPVLYGQTALICALIEMVLLLLIYILYKRDHYTRLHDRWLEYRCIAEFLRPTLFLSLFSSHFPMRRFRDSEEVLGRNLLGHGGPERCWAYLYTETVLRWTGFSGRKMEQTYLSDALRFTQKHWIHEQYHYHTRNAIATKQMGRRLAKISEGMFVATIIVVATKILLTYYLPEYYTISKLCGLLAAWLPVIGTTAFAIRNHAEFEISAQRSLSAREVLLGYHCNISALGSGAFTAKEIETLLRELTAQSITETADWLEIYEVKDTETA